MSAASWWYLEQRDAGVSAVWAPAGSLPVQRTSRTVEGSPAIWMGELWPQQSSQKLALLCTPEEIVPGGARHTKHLLSQPAVSVGETHGHGDKFIIPKL